MNEEIESGSTDGAAPEQTGGWTISALCIGLCLIAACVLIPQADANGRLLYERAKLRADLRQIDEQSAVNKEFLSKVETDPQLAERLALRQMRVVRRGEKVLDLKTDPPAQDGAPIAGTDETEAAQMSPFMIVNVPPPDSLPAYSPAGGLLTNLLLEPHSRLYLMGAGLFLVAMALILGDATRTKEKPAEV